MKIIQKGTFDGDIIQTTLDNRDIKDLELFLNPDNSTDSDPMEFLNADKGRELLYKHLSVGSRIVIVVDADADGYTSAAELYQYIKDLDPNVDLRYIVHETKAHGLTDKVMDEIALIGPKLVITPDSSSNDTMNIEKLESVGINVLVLDHHIVSEFTDAGVIVNNTLCPVTNHQFVGAGVVYKFVQGIDIEKGTNFADKYLDLVAIGQIGDSSDIANNEIRNLVVKGLSNIKSKFVKVAIEEKLGLGQKVSPKDLSFNVIPIINAVTRVGTLEERKILFEALACIDDTRIFPVEKKKKNKDTGKFDKVNYNFDLFRYAYDLCLKAKARQDSAVKKMVAALEESVVDDAGVIIAYTDNNDNPGITGLVANKLMTKFDKPVLLLNEQEETFTGSGRGHEKTLADFREFCEESQLVEFAQGHDNAFGICIRKEKIDAFKDYTRKIKKQKTVYEVDIISDKPDKAHCEQVDRNKHLFGGSVREPFIGVIGLSVPKRFLGLKGSVLNIFSWGVSCVKFNSNANEFDELMDYPGENVIIDMVGYYNMNEWSGVKKPQFIIKDYQIVYQKEEEINEDNIIF